MATRNTATLSLSFSGEKLPDTDFGPGKTDGYVIVKRKDARGQWAEIGRTEVINNDLNPKWKTEILVPYVFGQPDDLQFTVADEDHGKKDDQLLETRVQIDRLLRDAGATFPVRGRKNAKLHVVAQIVETKNERLTFKCSATVPKMDGLFGKCDPFLTFERAVLTDDGKTERVSEYHQTEVVEKSLKPTWKPFTLTDTEFCNADDVKRVTVKAWDSDGPGDREYIGEVVLTLGELRAGKQGPWDIVKVKNGKPGKKRGTLTMECKIVQYPTFVEFVRAGLEVEVSYMVDVTGSNGDWRSDDSLHSLGGGKTQYERGITAVDKVMAAYDTDGKKPLGFFGGVHEGTSGTSHNYQAGEFTTEEEFTKLYRDTIRTTRFSGPTYFHEFLQDAATVDVKKGVYRVIVVFCDGAVHEIGATKRALRALSDKNVSVLIVGIGGADFGAMEDLDDQDDDEVGIYRDLTDFVAQRKYPTPEAMRAALLTELPGHIEEFMKRQGYRPEDIKA